MCVCAGARVHVPVCAWARDVVGWGRVKVSYVKHFYARLCSFSISHIALTASHMYRRGIRRIKMHLLLL